MKNHRRPLLLAFSLLLSTIGCGAGSASDEGRGGILPGPSSDSTGTAGGFTTGAAGTSGAAGTTGAAGTGFMPPPQSGTLTAGTWDDNLNYDFYLRYLASMDARQMPGLPTIPRERRMEIRALDGAGRPLAGARVKVSGAAGKMFEAPTRGDGKVFFFPGAVGAAPGEQLQVSATFGTASAAVPAAVGDASVDVRVVGATAVPPAALDLALVIDTTGSMGDELSYLKVEMKDIVARVAAEYPNVVQRWALILYRDAGDEYVVRTFDFTSTLSTFQSALSAQAPGGGGDFPEAPDQALAKLTTLSWSQDAVARLAFWIADAPHHSDRAGTMTQDILTAQALGIRIYPVSASGTDELLEYSMRSAAQVTGGRYLFLTNDSGVGGSHKEPTIPCYVVTALDKAMLRMIQMELDGTDVPPLASDVVRTTGNPSNGQCTLASGQAVNLL
jgi:hypothetical protein